MSAADIAGARTPGSDSGLFTEYKIARHRISFTICGSLEQTFGCYFSGKLDRFEHACAVLSGDVTTNGDVLTQPIYVLDKRKAAGDPVYLYVYTRTDTINASADTVNVVLKNKIQLPTGFKGGSAARCAMAANSVSVFVSTNISSDTYLVDKTSLVVTGLGIGSASSVTSDGRGFVTMNVGNGTTVVYDPYSAFAGTAFHGDVLINASNSVLNNN
jgi:hypothetical protein